jgi:hypothetical protein
MEILKKIVSFIIFWTVSAGFVWVFSTPFVVFAWFIHWEINLSLFSPENWTVIARIIYLFFVVLFAMIMAGKPPKKRT